MVVHGVITVHAAITVHAVITELHETRDHRDRRNRKIFLKRKTFPFCILYVLASLWFTFAPLNYLLTYVTAYQLHRAESFLTSQPFLSQSRNSQHFMKPEGSLLHSQEPVTCPYPEPDRSSPCPTSHFLKIYLNIILPSATVSPQWYLYLRFPHQNPVYASPPYVLHAPPISFF
jgi:hypothetical protein